MNDTNSRQADDRTYGYGMTYGYDRTYGYGMTTQSGSGRLHGWLPRNTQLDLAAETKRRNLKLWDGLQSGGSRQLSVNGVSPEHAQRSPRKSLQCSRVRPFVRLSIRPFVRLRTSVNYPVHLSRHPFHRQSVRHQMCPSVRSSVRLSVQLYVCLPVCLLCSFVYFFVCAFNNPCPYPSV